MLSTLLHTPTQTMSSFPTRGRGGKASHHKALADMVSKRLPNTTPSSAFLHLDTRFATPDDIPWSDTVSQIFWTLLTVVGASYISLCGCMSRFSRSFLTLLSRTCTSSGDQPRKRVNNASEKPSSPSLNCTMLKAPTSFYTHE